MSPQSASPPPAPPPSPPLGDLERALDGTLVTDPGQLALFGRDFGRLVEGRDPMAVLVPRSDRDLVTVIRFAREHGLRVAMNGRSGESYGGTGGAGGAEAGGAAGGAVTETGADVPESHSSYGQATVPGGIAVDARGLNRILASDTDTVTVESGVTWAELTEYLLPLGLTPPALPDYMHLSVGGTLSIGGMGSAAATHGMLVDTVVSVDVVTGTGELVTASERERPDLFEAALGGGGQAGIIVRATMRVTAAPTRATVFHLYYDDLATYLADAEHVLMGGRFERQSGEMARRPDGSGWWWTLVGVALHTVSRPDRHQLLHGLHDVRSEAMIEDMAYIEYAFRLDPYVAMLKETGHWHGPKPWIALYLPASTAGVFLGRLERVLTVQDVGAGVVVTYPVDTARFHHPLVSLPDERVVHFVNLLRFPPPGTAGERVEQMLAQNRRMYETAVAIGGTRFLSSAVPRMTPEEWRRHFGPAYGILRAAKERYDPDGVLTPGPGFFGAGAEKGGSAEGRPVDGGSPRQE